MKGFYNIREAYHEIVFNSLLLYRKKSFFGLWYSQRLFTLDELANDLEKHSFATIERGPSGAAIAVVFKNEISISQIESALLTQKELEIARKFAPKRDKAS